MLNKSNDFAAPTIFDNVGVAPAGFAVFPPGTLPTQ